ncbi:hypothetical protein Ocin01_00300 [Orchesella cincta]|uniref:Uncharacterized protein n=1 Tax=Orchesella cincta TaxID=48709 RepID=A0A1D2NMC9_ORCCI|nr:hypothetical protein Ocin01_00300 [Orchesella cincta]
MSFSEYSGSKTKVSHAVGRLLRNAQGNLPKLQGAQVTTLLKSVSPTTGCKNGSERLNKPCSQTTPTSSKFGFQKLRLPGLDKKNNNHHAELLDNQDAGEDQESGDEMESSTRQTHAALIGSSATQKPAKRWPFHFSSN